jgi:two-component system cell cycle response regulator
MTVAATILVAEDSLVIRAVLRHHLEAEGYTVVEAVDGQTAIDRCHLAPPDAILLDIEMPGLNGHQVLAHLKSDGDLKDVPVVFLTGRTGTEDIVAGLRAGAHDYLKKPFEPAELIARVGTAERTKRLQDMLKTQSAKFDQISRTDALTGLYNRRHLHEQLTQLGSSSVRHRHSLAVVILDIDFFKRVNDSVGHQAGDDVLKEFTRRFQANKRDEDVTGRWGGEEFLMILPESEIDGAMAAAERIRLAVASTPFAAGDRQLAVTVSAGCAAGAGDDTDNLVRRADEALYLAKEAGRNQVLGATDAAAPVP